MDVGGGNTKLPLVPYITFSSIPACICIRLLETVQYMAIIPIMIVSSPVRTDNVTCTARLVEPLLTVFWAVVPKMIIHTEKRKYADEMLKALEGFNAYLLSLRGDNRIGKTTKMQAWYMMVRAAITMSAIGLMAWNWMAENMRVAIDSTREILMRARNAAGSACCMMRYQWMLRHTVLQTSRRMTGG